jgi:hypothetical protein
MRLQDRDGPLRAGGIFHNGRLIAEAPDDQTEASELRNWLAKKGYPGCEVLACCNTHPGAAAVDSRRNCSTGTSARCGTSSACSTTGRRWSAAGGLLA